MWEITRTEWPGTQMHHFPSSSFPEAQPMTPNSRRGPESPLSDVATALSLANNLDQSSQPSSQLSFFLDHDRESLSSTLGFCVCHFGGFLLLTHGSSGLMLKYAILFYPSLASSWGLVLWRRPRCFMMVGSHENTFFILGIEQDVEELPWNCWSYKNLRTIS